MYCTKCGSQNPDNASTCSACGAVLNNMIQGMGQGPGSASGPVNQSNVPNYLVHSILVTLFCCLPLGIVSIITSMKVDERLRIGDYSGAVDASNKAKNFCLISLGLGIAVYVIYFIFDVLANL